MDQIKGRSTTGGRNFRDAVNEMRGIRGGVLTATEVSAGIKETGYLQQILDLVLNFKDGLWDTSKRIAELNDRLFGPGPPEDVGEAVPNPQGVQPTIYRTLEELASCRNPLVRINEALDRLEKYL